MAKSDFQSDFFTSETFKFNSNSISIPNWNSNSPTLFQKVLKCSQTFWNVNQQINKCFSKFSSSLANSVQDVWWRRNPETYRNVVFLRKIIYNYIICILKGLTNEASFYVFLSIKNFNVYKSFFQVKKLIGTHFMVPMKRKRLK